MENESFCRLAVLVYTGSGSCLKEWLLSPSHICFISLNGVVSGPGSSQTPTSCYQRTTFNPASPARPLIQRAVQCSALNPAQGHNSSDVIELFLKRECPGLEIQPCRVTQDSKCVVTECPCCARRDAPTSDTPTVLFYIGQLCYITRWTSLTLHQRREQHKAPPDPLLSCH